MGDKQTVFKYTKGFNWYRCERCRQVYSVKWIEFCQNHRQTPDLNYCQNCGARIEAILGGPQDD